MNIHSTRALVLKNTAHGESDLLITLYSDQLGKVTAIAKGAKRSKKRFVNKLELFSKIAIDYKLSRASTLLFLVEAELEDAHIALRYDPKSYIIAAYLCELITKFTREHDQDRPIFNLLEWAFKELCCRDKQIKVAALFHLKLLTLAGYQPQLDVCAQCGREIAPPLTYSLLPGNGAVSCSHCTSSRNEYDRLVSLQSLKFMQRGIELDLHRITRLSIPDQVAQDILTILHGYSRQLLQQEFHSWKMVRQTMQQS